MMLLRIRRLSGNANLNPHGVNGKMYASMLYDQRNVFTGPDLELIESAINKLNSLIQENWKEEPMS